VKFKQEWAGEIGAGRIFFYTAIKLDFTINQMIVKGCGGVYFFIRKE